MNANCQRCQPLLSAYIDKETTAREEEFIRQHLLTCLDCRSALESYRGIRVQLKRVPDPLPPPELRRTLLNRVHQERIRGAKPALLRGNGLKILSLSLMAAIVLIIAAVLIAFFTNRNSAFEVADIAANSQEITIHFNQAVDEALIRDKGQLFFNVKDDNGKKIDYDIKVIDSQTVVLEPKETLVAGQQVNVETNTSVLNKSGENLAQKHIEVKIVSPAPATTRQTTTVATTQPRTTVIAQVATVTPSITSTTAVSATPTITTTAAITATTVFTTVTTPILTSTTVISPTEVVTTTSSLTLTTIPTVTTIPLTTTVTTSPPVTVTTDITATTVPVTPSPTPTCNVAVSTSFTKLLTDNPDIATKLGCPSAAENTVTLAYQVYEKGFMLASGGQIYAFSTLSSSWRSYADIPATTPTPTPTATASSVTIQATGTATTLVAQLTTPTPTATPGNFGCSISPAAAFANVWRANLEVRNLVGCPGVLDTSSRTGITQLFAGGRLFLNPVDMVGRRIYIMFNSGSLLILPDTSGA
ncbi:MAG: zf-HC2 domain-containing protein [Chloroflexi bacterium]|uniref:Zf-HC2 domain-containing protein n=1 Tax=Candidatus Chlorohelix allophototropha TaxID=3003348 RepID=A0A8T7MA63_9CHLR|nr:zf-HC2 domain-containing protein [Chloroflexota bacterium]WJW68947.1 zf-HC2 domain-containing protein [Chloroflexota bacterium L227-S17]